MGQFAINMDKARSLIQAFLVQRPLFELAQKEGIGGTLMSDSLKDKGVVFRGFMGWLCRGNDELFMAFEQGFYDPDAVPAVPKSTDLVRTSSIIRFPYDQPFEESIDAMLAYKWPKGKDFAIDKSDVVSMLGKVPPDSHARIYNNYKCSFFENDAIKDVEQMLAQGPYVRYFLGYDGSDKMYFDSNRVRLILFSVDSFGAIIPPDSYHPGIIALEQTWPPPPPGNKEKTKKK